MITGCGLIMGDTHHGHVLGLTDPECFRRDLMIVQEPFWSWWEDQVRLRGPFDFAIDGGDMVEGPGKKDTTGLLLPDTMDQVNMAVRIRSALQIPKWYIACGTGYHVQTSHSLEEQVAAELRGEAEVSFGPSHRIAPNGYRIQVEHKLNRSGTPYGQETMLSKEAVRVVMDDMMCGRERADLVIRHHAHLWAETKNGKTRAILCPALKLSERQFAGAFEASLRSWGYDVGFVVLTFFTCDEPRVDVVLYRRKHRMEGDDYERFGCRIPGGSDCGDKKPPGGLADA